MAALVYTLHAIISLLSTNPFVIVIALDFSKAFDNVRHSTLLHKIAQLDIPENVYNWFLDLRAGCMGENTLTMANFAVN